MSQKVTPHFLSQTTVPDIAITTFSPWDNRASSQDSLNVAHDYSQPPVFTTPHNNNSISRTKTVSESGRGVVSNLNQLYFEEKDSNPGQRVVKAATEQKQHNLRSRSRSNSKQTKTQTTQTDQVSRPAYSQQITTRSQLATHSNAWTSTELEIEEDNSSSSSEVLSVSKKSQVKQDTSTSSRYFLRSQTKNPVVEEMSNGEATSFFPNPFFLTEKALISWKTRETLNGKVCDFSVEHLPSSKTFELKNKPCDFQGIREIGNLIILKTSKCDNHSYLKYENVNSTCHLCVERIRKEFAWACSECNYSICRECRLEFKKK